MEKLLFTYLGLEKEGGIQLSFAHRLGSMGKVIIGGKERDILLGFPNGALKALVLNTLWEKPKIMIEGQQLTFYSDLCPIMLQRKEWSFLTVKPVSYGVPYKWGFLHKLLIDYKGRVIVIKSAPQARQFEKELGLEKSDKQAPNLPLVPTDIKEGIGS